MGLGTAIINGFTHYFDFWTRTSRGEYWWWVLFLTLASIVFGMFDAAFSLAPVAPEGQFTTFDLLDLLYTVGAIIPSFSITARRLHDIDRSGWWQLLILIPILGWFMLLAWMARPGDVGSNRFGDDPLAQWRNATGFRRPTARR